MRFLTGIRGATVVLLTRLGLAGWQSPPDTPAALSSSPRLTAHPMVTVWSGPCADKSPLDSRHHCAASQSRSIEVRRPAKSKIQCIKRTRPCPLTSNRAKICATRRKTRTASSTFTFFTLLAQCLLPCLFLIILGNAFLLGLDLFCLSFAKLPPIRAVSGPARVQLRSKDAHVARLHRRPCLFAGNEIMKPQMEGRSREKAVSDRASGSTLARWAETLLGRD